MTEYQNHIETNPEIMFGKPCIKGTRVPVDLILEKLKDLWTFEDLLDAYPRINEKDVLACIDFEKKGFDTRGLLLNITN